MKKMTRKARPLFKSGASTPATSTPSTASTSSNSSGGGGGILRRTTWADKIRDKLPALEENEYEVLWERGVLGVIFLESERDGIPYVSKATETCISPEVQPGDTLKYVNIVRSKDHSFSDFFKILATMKKPVLLRFERANAGTPTSDDESSVRAPPLPGFDQRSNSSSSLGSGAGSPRSSKYQRANSVPPNEQKPPKTSHSRGAFWRTSSGRDSTIPPPSSAHPPPAPRDGDDGIFRVGREHEVSPQHTPNGSARTPREPAAYQEYEVYWETGSLGLFFGEDRMTNLPVVTRSTSSANAVVQRMVAVNDTLVSANGIQSRDYSFDTFFSRLQQMNKPVRLVFRRPRREASPGKPAPGRKPSMTVDTNLSPGGMNLRHRQLSGDDSPLSGRSNTPPLPPSPHVNVPIGQQYRRESERNPSPLAQSTLPGPSPVRQDRASVKVVSPPSTANINDARMSRAAPSAGVPRLSPNGSDENARRHLPSSSTNGSKDPRSSVRVPSEDAPERFSVRGSERRGRSSRAMDTNFRLSSKTSPRPASPERNDSGSWATASPSPTIHTALDDNVPKASTPPHSQADLAPSPAETSDSYKSLFGPPSPTDGPTDKGQASPTTVEQGPDVEPVKVPPPALLATPAKPPSPTPPAVVAEPGSPAKPSSPRDIWSMASEDAVRPTAEEAHELDDPETFGDVETHHPAEQSKPSEQPPIIAREDRVPTVSLDEDLDRSDSDSSSDGDVFGIGDDDIGDDIVEAGAVEVDLIVAEPLDVPDVVADVVTTPESLPVTTTRLSNEDDQEDIQTGEIAEIDIGIVVDADDEYQLRDEVDVGSDTFGDDDKHQAEEVPDMDGVTVEERGPGSLPRGADEEDADDEEEIDLLVDASRGSSDGVDMKTEEDPVDEDSEALEPLVSDPDISSDVDVVAASSMGEVSRINDVGVVNSAKANKPPLNANLAKYKKKGKSARGMTRLPALAEAEALTVPLVAPNAVNTTVQVRGRPKPKQTMMDTPDGATYLVKWKENRSIGLQLKEVRLGKGVFPLVTDVCQEPCCEALKHICVGDVIVEINGKNTSSMGVKKTVTFLKSCSKTTLMKLRHGPAYVSQRVSAYI